MNNTPRSERGCAPAKLGLQTPPHPTLSCSSQTTAPSRSRTFVCLREKALDQLRVLHLLPAHGNIDWKPHDTRERANEATQASTSNRLPQTRLPARLPCSYPSFPHVGMEGKVCKAEAEREKPATRRSSLRKRALTSGVYGS